MTSLRLNGIRWRIQARDMFIRIEQLLRPEELTRQLEQDLDAALEEEFLERFDRLNGGLV